jgi:hypothetical protein
LRWEFSKLENPFYFRRDFSGGVEDQLL